MNAKVGLGIGARHITVSTCGIIEGIDRFASEPEQFTLAISLHSAIQATRDKIMPGVRKCALEDLRNAVMRYSKQTGRRPSFEYAPMQGINDNDDHIDALVSYCKDMLCHVNLIPLNPIGKDDENKGYAAPSTRMDNFAEALELNHIEHSIRKSRGNDIDGACGQLRQRFDS